MYSSLCEGIAATCKSTGFDLAYPLRVGRYNTEVEPEYRLPDFGNPESLAIVIGNTKALWPVFRRAVAADATLAKDPNPLDRYTERCIRAALTELTQTWEVRFAYEKPPRRVAMQRIAHIAGMAYMSPSYLSVHPVYGPWIALRAVVVIDVPGPKDVPELKPPCQCHAHCKPWFRKALEVSQNDESGGQKAPDNWRSKWHAWVAVRDACPVGREYRYDESQIRYHYIKDKSQI